MNEKIIILIYISSYSDTDEDEDHKREEEERCDMNNVDENWDSKLSSDDEFEPINYSK